MAPLTLLQTSGNFSNLVSPTTMEIPMNPAMILVVDDEPDLELLIRQRFRRRIQEGIIEFEFAINGEEALRKLADPSRVFDVVLTDINMPVMDGLTLLTRIKEQEGPYKAVVVSAYGDLENIRTAMNRGAFDFITKPIDFPDLETTIEKTVNEVRMIRKGLQAHEQLESTIQEKEIAEEEKDRAVQSERFKQQFLANMSHEIRTPMNSIVGLTNLLMKTDLSQQQSRYLDVIRKSSENLLVIINDILDISKIEAGKMVFEHTPFRIAEILDLLYETMHFRAEEKQLSLVFDCSPEVPEVLVGDPVRLNQVLTNLIGNAVKFTEKGMIRLDVRVLNKGTTKVILEFTIIDTGVGIAPGLLEKIFDSFSQASSDTNRRFGGTGLGLTISKELIEMQGGSILVSSEVGKGTTFSFRLPVDIGRPSDTVTSDSADSHSYELSPGFSILLVEDNPFNQIVAIDTLKDLYKEVDIEVAENGATALEMLREGAFDLVLMDIQMPIMDGFEATRRIRSELPAGKSNVKIMAMTANVTTDEVARCFESGVDDYIAKPFDPKSLFDKIGKLV